MISARAFILIAGLAIAGCGTAPEEPQFRSYDLTVTHPAPYATYLSIAPGTQGGDLPRLRQITSRGFSEYLRASTGCSVDTSRQTSAMGHKRMPAGYMVPVMCH